MAKTRYYAKKGAEADKLIRRIGENQGHRGVFYNIAVRPYKGKKFAPDMTVTIVVG